MDYQILMRVLFKESHSFTGYYVHLKDFKQLPKPAELQICQYPNSQEYYIIYYDKDGNWLSDTLHDSLDDALERAEKEFDKKPDEWEIVEG